MTSLTVRRKVAKNPRRKAVAKRRVTKSRKAIAHRKRNAAGHFVKAKNSDRTTLVKRMRVFGKMRKKSAGWYKGQPGKWQFGNAAGPSPSAVASKVRKAKSTKKARKTSEATRRALKRSALKRSMSRNSVSTSSIRAAVSSAVRSALKANPRKRRTVTAKRKKRNPAPSLLITLGAQNPRRRKSTVAKAKRRNPSRRRRNTRVVARRKASSPFAVRARARSANPRRRSHRRRNPSRNGRRRNPSVFGANVPSGNLIKMILGGLLGVTATKMVVAMLPANLLSNNFVKVLASGAVAVMAGQAAKAIPSAGEAFADAVMFGGMMQTGSVALNLFLPSVGSRIALAGRRGVGDLVDAQFSLPEQPMWSAARQIAAAKSVPATIPVAAMSGMKRAWGPTY